ncbi:hypothetical protein JQK15_21535 [Sphingobium sp. BHU LFT2]|uniref:hypothetical protein n=1 Tax=Sphingobium sp. BHU LFT2 TaxID=2807634 RepID=UPI001BEB1842|nr:hypothetical protein [Sphingobium sp. BHU LFT2]MBT2246091.1 hypothetical protein [Sphingobium sp. BHU LFT2]
MEDYGHVGFTLRQHPVSFLREELLRQKMVPCSNLDSVKDGRYVWLAGLVLVRQRPGSAKGVMFSMIKDQTGIATSSSGRACSSRTAGL